MVRWVEEAGWTILNGCTEGDEKGEWTYTGGGDESVIDYEMGDEEVRDWVMKLEVGDNVDSYHRPVIVRIRGGG